MTGVHVVSLIFLEDQEIPSRTWTTVRFPYAPLSSGAYDTESTDVWCMHEPDRPEYNTMPRACNGALAPVTGPVTDWHADEGSGLIWPSKRGWGAFEALFSWRAGAEPGPYTEIEDRFVRDPFGVPNATGMEHRPPSPGVQYFAKTHSFMVKPGVPVAVQVWHNQSTPLVLADGQFKLAIHDVEEPA